MCNDMQKLRVQLDDLNHKKTHINLLCCFKQVQGMILNEITMHAFEPRLMEINLP